MKTQTEIEIRNRHSQVVEPGDDLDDELRPEYTRADLKNGVRGKHLADYRSGTNLVLLDSDVAAVFTSQEAVNAVLRALIQTMPQPKERKSE